MFTAGSAILSSHIRIPPELGECYNSYSEGSILISHHHQHPHPTLDREEPDKSSSYICHVSGLQQPRQGNVVKLLKVQSTVNSLTRFVNRL